MEHCNSWFCSPYWFHSTGKSIDSVGIEPEVSTSLALNSTIGYSPEKFLWTFHPQNILPYNPSISKCHMQECFFRCTYRKLNSQPLSAGLLLYTMFVTILNEHTSFYSPRNWGYNPRNLWHCTNSYSSLNILYVIHYS